MLVRALLAIALVIPLAPSAAAARPCADVTDAASPLGEWYVVPSPSDPEVWRETNGVAGLQREECVDGDGLPRGKDLRQLAFHVPQPDELPCHVSGRQVVCDG